VTCGLPGASAAKIELLSAWLRTRRALNTAIRRGAQFPVAWMILWRSRCGRITNGLQRVDARTVRTWTIGPVGDVHWLIPVR
jgi:hypothetical protein